MLSTLRSFSPHMESRIISFKFALRDEVPFIPIKTFLKCCFLCFLQIKLNVWEILRLLYVCVNFHILMIDHYVMILKHYLFYHLNRWATFNHICQRNRFKQSILAQSELFNRFKFLVKIYNFHPSQSII